MGKFSVLLTVTNSEIEDAPRNLRRTRVLDETAQNQFTITPLSTDENMFGANC